MNGLTKPCESGRTQWSHHGLTSHGVKLAGLANEHIPFPAKIRLKGGVVALATLWWLGFAGRGLVCSNTVCQVEGRV